MVRKIATQIPSAVSRLLQANTIPPPVWYQPVLAHPPTPLPPRANGQSSPSASTSANSGPSLRHRTLRSNKAHGLKPQPIIYEEDNIRRRFFQDFPFEALRSVTLVEGQQVGEEDQVDGKEWASLAQRGAYPTVEDTIAFTLNLHHAHSLSIASAYLAAVKQFADLRAKHELATFQAEEERMVLGRMEEEEGVVGGREKGTKDVFQRFFDLESQARQSFNTSKSSSSSSSSTPQGPPSAMTRRRAWSPNVSPKLTESIEQLNRSNKGFTGGLEYSAGWIGDVWKSAMKDTGASKTIEGDVLGDTGSGSQYRRAQERPAETTSSLDAQVQDLLRQPARGEVGT